ncbi:MAG: hypothetical protein SFY56_00145 [Bacteroidota bacterium]|nr:hypothetical protein [Bacteroidota bacterium]
MRKNQFIIILLFLIATNFKAQDTLNSFYVESNSYKLYTEKNWTELIKFGNQAIKQDFDYYYLRIRLGIAYFESGNYYGAERHFEKALSFNSDDELVLEYLYFCFIYTAHFEEAMKLSKTFNKQLTEKLKTDKTHPIGYVIAEGGVKTTDSTKILGNGNYFHIGLGHYIAKQFSLFHGLTYFSQTFADHYGSSGQATQFQYYLKATIPLKNNWQVLPGFHYITKTTTFRIKNVQQILSPPPGLPPPPPQMETFRDSSANANYFVGSITIRKSIYHFDFSIGATASSVFGNNQIQNFANITYSPFKKDKLLLGLNGFIHSEDNYSSSNFAMTPFVSVNPIPKLNLFCSYLYNGGGRNVVESNGYIVNNSTDLTSSRWSVIASLAVTKQFDIYGLYQFETKEQEYQKYAYHFNLFVLGVKFKP